MPSKFKALRSLPKVVLNLGSATSVVSCDLRENLLSESLMNRRERIAQKLVRIAVLREQASLVALAEAEREREEAAAVVAEIEAAQARAEAELTRGGVLSGLNRELLWTNRSRARVDRELGEELLAESARVLDAARAEMYQRKQQVRSRERVYDYVHAEAIAELRKKEQRELDDLAGQRWSA